MSVSAVAANENTTQTFKEVSADSVSVSVETKDEILGISNSEESLGATDNNKILCATDDGTFKALQDKIDNAPLGSVVILENDYKNTDNFNKNGITISKSLTIDGNGYTIDALSKGRIFQVTASNVILKNINFVNGNNSDGGGAVYWSGIYGTVDNCTFVNNSASTGGAIRGPNDYSTVKNCIFINNSANHGGAIFSLVNKDIPIINCTFIDNQATGSGGAIWNRDLINLILCDNTFIRNSARDSGGAIFYLGEYNDYPRNFDCFPMYGMVWNLTNSNFVNNTATNGGAVFIEYGYGNILINNSTFSGNSAHKGGAVFIHGEFAQHYKYFIDNSQFLNNGFNCNLGGAIYSSTSYAANYSGIISNSQFLNNGFNCHEGGAIYGYLGYVINSTFVNNSKMSQPFLMINLL